MSLRGDILGWVIRRLSETDAADEVLRAELFRALRDEVTANGFGGASAAEALSHFESAVARQEMHWLRETADSAPPPPPSPAAPASPVKPAWKWPEGLALPAEPAGPFSDHVYEFVALATPSGKARLRIGWAYDPACLLSAECPEITFSFRTRAANFGYAVDHLAEVLRRGGLELPGGIRHLDL